MQVILAGIVLWFFVSAFLIFAAGVTLWLIKRFSPLGKVDGSNWARLTAFALLLPPSFGFTFTVASLTSAFLCPATSVRYYHLCEHSVKHFCGHAAATNVFGSQIAFWCTLVWFGLASAILMILMCRRLYIKRIEPSPKLRQAIANVNFPSNLPVWETGSDLPALLVGVVSPSIFVSQELIRRLPTSALEVVLLHEYAHLVRRDHWLRPLIFIVSLVFAPIPFAVWLQREWQDASEKAADDFATGNEKSAKLLIFALKVLQSIWIPMSAEQLANRVKRLKSQRAKNISENSLSSALIICGLSLCSLIFCFPSLWLTLHCFAEVLILK